MREIRTPTFRELMIEALDEERKANQIESAYQQRDKELNKYIEVKEYWLSGGEIL
ncbi:MAG: hypothetical protein PVJ67_00990 [Candidatus Pacearchaeota archaeon]|jgi:hypothetical protein